VDLFDHDRRFLEVVDRVMDDARRAAGDAWACGPGRTECCIGPFPINLLDARRLIRGLAEMAGSEPARAARIEARAREAVERMRSDFAGDAEQGILTEDDAAQDAFFECHGDRPCPALDPATGRCEVYAFRPWTCRTFGPPIQIGHERLPPCPHCFAPCSGEEEDRLRVIPDPDGLEAALLDALERDLGLAGETIVAFALLGMPMKQED
jgi:Fe-S-cluster containining protein